APAPGHVLLVQAALVGYGDDAEPGGELAIGEGPRHGGREHCHHESDLKPCHVACNLRARRRLVHAGQRPRASSITALTLCTSYLASAISRLRAPMRSTREGSETSSIIAAASAAGSRGGTRRPLSPWTTVSRQPGTSVVITARPVDMASKTERGVPSR